MGAVAGIYIHIPFCKQACSYCNFHFSASVKRKNELVEALLDEIELRQDYLDTRCVETVYFGGGTPSLLEPREIHALAEKISSVFELDDVAEITLEANPDDITHENLKQWIDSGINRLSIGIQSFFDDDLRWMNRSHDSKQAMESLELAKKCFNNITIDLIYGSPAMTDEKWKLNIERAIQRDVPHISCYALTVEAKTPLYKMIRSGMSEDVDPEKQSRQFLLLMDMMSEAGYEHYEISNFAKPAYRSRHNSAYWSNDATGERIKYLGIGPSAHSFDGMSRQWNVSNNKVYIDSIRRGMAPSEMEILTPIQQVNEYIMTSLRTLEGLDLEVVKKGHAMDSVLLASKKFIERGFLVKQNNHLQLTREGKLLADGIASELFLSETAGC